jgi:hypothetical protein
MYRNFKTALYDDEVYGHIFAVVHKVKKAVKVATEVKTVIDEFEALLLSIRNDADGRPITDANEIVSADDDNTGNRDEDSYVAAPKTPIVNKRNAAKGNKGGAALKSAKFGADGKLSKSKSKKSVVSDEEDGDIDVSDAIDEFDTDVEDENKFTANVKKSKSANIEKSSAVIRTKTATETPVKEKKGTGLRVRK